MGTKICQIGRLDILSITNIILMKNLWIYCKEMRYEYNEYANNKFGITCW